MAVCRVSFFLCLLAVVVPLVVADGTARRKVPSVGDISEESLKEYMEEQQGKVEPPAKNDSPLLLYLHLLRLKRREQVETVEKVMSVKDYSQQYKTVAMLLDTLFPELEKALGKMETAGYSPGSPFPEDRALQEEVGKIYENVLMFGDFLLRMPEMTKKLYNKRTEWTGLFRWAFKFCMLATDVFNGPYATHLELMRQELAMGPRDPNYRNPFSSNNQDKIETEEDNVKDKVQSRREAMQEKMKNTKGPRLRTNRHNEL